MTRAKGPPPAGSGSRAAPASRLLFVDAIEGDHARLLLGVDAFTVPARLLPSGAKEGSWLRASFELTAPPPEDAEAQALRRRLGKDDDGGDIKL
jgi:hypothetical protein